MSLLFHCDWCGHETDDPKSMTASNLLQLAKDRTGKDVDTVSPLLPNNEHSDYCNACYRLLKDWCNGSLRNWIRDNFPLIKKNASIH